jgi:hypothetical protein
VKKRFSWFAVRARSYSLVVLLGACGSEPPQAPSESGSGVAGQGGAAANHSSAGTTPGGAASTPGGGQTLGGAGAFTAGGGVSATNAGGGVSGTSGAGAENTGGGTTAGGGSGGMSGSAGTFGMAGTSGSANTGGAGPVIPPGCVVSNPVSFKKDIGPWLAKSCGKATGGGCHVVDDASTANSLCPDGTKTCGFNHAYDWITAGSHNEYCKQPTTPIRYTVVMAVLDGANPPACSKTRVMPPDGPPTSDCQKAALAAWLAEPKVVQLHRSDDTSPTEAYPMPPFN